MTPMIPERDFCYALSLGLLLGTLLGALAVAWALPRRQADRERTP